MTSRLAVERRYLETHHGEAFDEAWHDSHELVYQVEDYRDVLPELRELLPEHWSEIALDKEEIQLEPDYETYETMADAGILFLVTLREGHAGPLVGYHLSMIRGHLHYKSSLTCFTDVFYLKPSHRTGMVGYKMLKFFRDSVKARGVQKIYMGTKLEHDIGPLLDRLGFKPIERLYTMVFP